MSKGESRSRAIAAAALLVAFGVIVVAPIAFLYAESLWRDGAISFAAYPDALMTARQWTLLVRSVGLALVVSCCATVLGATAGFALQCIPPSIRAVLAFLLTMPVVIPQHIMAIAWVDVLGRSGYLSRFVQIALPGAPPVPGPYNLAGALLILSVTMYPIPMLATMAAMRRFDARYIEAAHVAAQSRRAFRAITLPLALPTILTGSLVVFALTVSTFAVPSLLQVNTYPVEIHASSLTFDYGMAAAQSLPLIAACALAIAAWSRYVRPRHAWLSGAARPVAAPTDGRVIALRLLSVLTLIATGLFLPLSALVVRSLPLRTYQSVWATAGDEIITGILVASVSATLLTVLAFALVFVVRGATGRRFVRYASLIAFVIPGPLFALGMIALWNRPGFFGAVYDSIAILALACVARFFALGDAAFDAQHARLNPRLSEAAAAGGVPWWRALSGIVLPLSLPYLVAVWVLTFVLSLGEVDSAVLLSPPGSGTFAVRLFSLMHYGPDSFVAALSVTTALGIGVLAACGAVAFRVLARRFDAGA